MSLSIRACIKSLEKLSLLTCSNEVVSMLERTLANVEPILNVDTRNVEPLLWQNDLSFDRLHDDKPIIRLTSKDLRMNAAGFFEDYIAVGHLQSEGKN